MDASSQFESVSITRSRDFSWVFFADWFLTFFLAIFIIFYFNRFVGVGISYLLRIFLWKSKKVKIDVQAVKLSFLGGRLFFKNLTIIDRDQTVCASQGSITWRYWIPTVRQTELSVSQSGIEANNATSNCKLPCRVIMEIDGLEAFIYNRTVSYENVMNTLNQKAGQKSEGTNEKEPYDVFSNSTGEDTLKSEDLEVYKPSQSLMAKILPIHVKINKGAVVAGNKTTQAILVMSYASADGSYDLLKAENPLDDCCQSFKANFEKLQISLKPNISYEERSKESPGIFYKEKPNRKKYANRWILYRSLVNLWRLYGPSKRDRDDHSEWRGLSQYLDNDSASISNNDGRELEYGKYTQLVDCDMANIEYYYDIPGLVPDSAIPSNPLDGIDIGNSGPAPKFGLNVQLYNATIFYGPWAERQRHSLHQMLYPTICRDGTPQERLKHGKLRMYTQYQMAVEITDEAILRIPIREFSKNEEYLHLTKDTPDTKRPFGWLELKMDKNSTISSTVGLIASRNGYDNRLKMALKNLEVRSSVNHDIMLRCKEHLITAEIGYPLKWNGHAIWTFLNESQEVDTFLLREHITLLSDMFTDFASGPATPYNLFRPFTYIIDWKVSKYAIYMNVNDANIVNNPLDFNDNCYLSFQGKDLDINLHIPLEAVLRKASTISFNLSTPLLSMVLDTPPWHTLNNFLEFNEVGRSQDFTIKGSYTYHSEVGLDLVDTIVIACKGKYMALECYGFVVKYLLSIKENYFGDFTRFRTLEEYTQMLNDEPTNSVKDDEEAKRKIFKRSENEEDVHFSFDVEEGCLILPSNIYSASSNVSLYFNTLNMDLRFTNYYMDFQADITPVKGIYVDSCDPSKVLDLTGYSTLKEHNLFVDGFAIHGHRMFGLPPDELKYFCKWDLAPGDIKFCGKAEALEGILSSVLKLGFGYKNLENSLLLEEPEINDTTSVSFAAPKITVQVDDPDIDSVLNLVLSEINFTFIDITNARFTEKISADIENISINIEEKSSTKTHFEAQTALRFTNFTHVKDFVHQRAKHDDHTIHQDGPFHRTPFFLKEELRYYDYNELYGSIAPSYSIPDAPPPLTPETVDLIFEDLGLEENGEDDYSSAMSVNTGSDDLDFFQDFNSEFLPSQAPRKRTFSAFKNYAQTVAGADIRPTSKYRVEDFAPQYVPDPRFEYDNFILNFGDIDVAVTPSSIRVLLLFAEKFITRSMTAVLDDLHINVLKKLNKLRNKEPSVKNIRCVTPRFNLNFGEFLWDSNLTPSMDTEHFNVTVENPSLVCSVVNTLENKEEVKMALNILSIVIGVYETNASLDPPIELSIHDLEVWSNKGKKDTVSVSLRKIDFNIQEEKVLWLKSYILKTSQFAGEVSSKVSQIKYNFKQSEIELLYQISMASTVFKVEHDPAVLTRPAYIIRHSRQHIRANDSWKVMIRLRHIFENLDPEWIKTHQGLYLKRDFEAPSTALEEVVGVFSSWRTWEFDDIEHSYVFRYVFSKMSKKEKLDLVFELAFEEISLQLIAESGQKNFVALDFLEVSGNSLKTLPSQPDSKKSNSLSVRLSSLKGELSPLLEVLRELKEPLTAYKKRREASQSEDIITTELSSLEDTTQLAIYLDTFDIEVDSFKVGTSFSGRDIGISMLHTKRGQLQDLTSTVSSKNLSFKVRSQNETSVSYSVDDLIVNIASVDDLKTGGKLVDMSVGAVMLSMEQSTDHYVKLINDLQEDITRFKGMKSSEKAESHTVDDGKEAIWDSIPTLTLNLHAKSLGWNISCFDPFMFTGSVTNYRTKASLLDRVVINHNELAKLTMDLRTKKLDILKMNSRNFVLSLAATIDTDCILVNSKIKSSETIILLADMLQNLKEVKIAVAEAKNSKIKLEDCLNGFKSKSSTVSENNNTRLAADNDKKMRLLTKVEYKATSFALGVKIHGTTVGLNFLDTGVVFRDFELLGNIPTQVKPFGDLNIGSAKLVIKNRAVSNSLSTILDVNCALKVFNTRTGDQVLQTLEIQSNYCRLVLHSRTIICLMEFVNDLKYVIRSLGLKSSSDKTPRMPQGEPEWQKHFHAVHMLFYNFCVGFIFDDATEEYPGVIAGCEKVFVVREENYGKLSLIHAYVSIAKGARSKNYYSIANELDSPNRAFLPNMQVMYAVKKAGNKKDWLLRATGEELDVKFVSSSIVLLEKALKSIGTIETLKKRIKKYPREPVTGSFQDAYRLPSDVTSISCVMNFAGGTVKLYRNDDYDALEDAFAPSFDLTTPAVKIAAEYSKTSGMKDHHVDFEVFTSSSSNTLYSTCVPVIMDIWSSVKRLGDRSGSSVDVEKKDDSNFAIKETDFLNVLTNFHVNLAIHIAKQELSLSCEPSAKVQAVVGIDGIDIRIGTNDDNKLELLSGAIKAGKISASLQHIYSRQISASVELDQILATLLLTGSEKIKVYAAGKIVDVASYVNLKQLQDVNLFKDLWFPHDPYPSSSNNSMYSIPVVPGSKDENLVSRFQKVSSTGAIPWNFDFSILNVNCKVDLGQSLGILSLELDKFWAASRKKTDWEQNMAIGFNTLSLRSAGRLSGFLSARDIRIHSVIQWSLVGETVDIPLVLLSVGFESIEAKASFDYNVFLIARILNSYATIYNQVDQHKVLKDKLVASIKCGSIEIFTTALAASNILDIYNTISRIRQDNKRLYKEDLKNAKRDSGDHKKTLDILNVIATLRTELELNFDKLLIQVYPGSLLDSQVLIIDVGGLTAHFEQKTEDGSIMTDLTLKLHNTSVALSSFKKQLPEEVLNEMSMTEYIIHSSGARGGGIFIFPSLESSMQTWQTPQSSVIEYKFRSTFGDKVDIRWNLGSVSFIREMWATHARALSSRLAKPADIPRKSISLFEDVHIEEKIKDVELEDKYKYVALESPIIEAPQLRDLGDATPPLEWFGLHRQRFPGITHQFVIIGLQKLVHEVEQQYGRVLGKA